MATTKTSFKKGEAKGRSKGAGNLVSQDLRQWITSFIEGNTTQIESDWKALDPKDRIVLFEKLLKYALPTLQSVASTISFDALSDQQLDEIINRLKNTPNND